MKMVDGDLLVQHKYNTLHKDLIFLVNDLSGSEKKKKKGQSVRVGFSPIRFIVPRSDFVADYY
jgi:hypothetical protein